MYQEWDLNYNKKILVRWEIVFGDEGIHILKMESIVSFKIYNIFPSDTFNVISYSEY